MVGIEGWFPMIVRCRWRGKSLALTSPQTDISLITLGSVENKRQRGEFWEEGFRARMRVHSISAPRGESPKWLWHLVALCSFQVLLWCLGCHEPSAPNRQGPPTCPATARIPSTCACATRPQTPVRRRQWGEKKPKILICFMSPSRFLYHALQNHVWVKKPHNWCRRQIWGKK